MADWFGNIGNWFSGSGGSVPSIASGDPAMAGIDTAIDLTRNPLPTGDPAMDAINMGITQAGTPISLNSGGSFGSTLKAGLEKLPDALKGLSSATKGAQAATADAQSKAMQIQNAATHQGQPGSLNELVGLLLQRQDAITKGQQSGTPVAQPTRLGLLGF